MTKEEFLENLKSDVWVDDPDELIKLRLPAVQFYLSNYVNVQYVINGHLFDSKSINIKYQLQDFTYVNQAYNTIKERYEKGEIK